MWKNKLRLIGQILYVIEIFLVAIFWETSFVIQFCCNMGIYVVNQYLANVISYQIDKISKIKNIQDAIKTYTLETQPTYGTLIKNNELVTVDPYIELSDPIVEEIIGKNDMSKKDSTTLVFCKDKINDLVDTIAVTTNKEKLKQLRYDLTFYQFQYQDLLLKYNPYSIQNEKGKSSKKKV